MKEEQTQTDSNSPKIVKDKTDRKKLTLEEAKQDKMYLSDHIEEIWAEIRFR